jgi:mannose-6-phosphate isomerase-like protein (cupin superfamily)
MKLLDKKIVPKLWGSEEWIVNNNLYCQKILLIKEGYQCSLHYHSIKDETFYVLEGEIELELGVRENPLEKVTLKEGDAIRVLPFIFHRFKSLYPVSKVLECSTQHFDIDSYRAQESKKI